MPGQRHDVAYELALLDRYPTFAGYWATLRAANDPAVRTLCLQPADAIDMMRRAGSAQARWGTTAPAPRTARRASPQSFERLRGRISC